MSATAKSYPRLVGDAFQGIFDHYHEKLVMAYYPYAAMRRLLDERITLQGEDDLSRALASGHGVILVTGHFGAVEYLPGVLAARGYPVSIIVKFQNSTVARLMKARAATADLELLDPGEVNVLQTALEALRRGRLLITECDEFDEWREGKDTAVEFLGTRLPGDRSLDILQRRSGAPVIMALVKRRPLLSYHLEFTPVAAAGTPSGRIGPRCRQVLEQAIYETPEQWYQWKKFGRMIHPQLTEASHADYASGYLAAESALYVAGQA